VEVDKVTICTNLEHSSEKLVAPINRVSMSMQRDRQTHLVSLNPPFLALVNALRTAIVITTSSGLFLDNVARPLGDDEKCEVSCLIRSMAVKSARCGGRAERVYSRLTMVTEPVMGCAGLTGTIALPMKCLFIWSRPITFTI
jgi:hypothetical protein